MKGEQALTLAAFAADYCDMGHRFPFSSHSYSDELANYGRSPASIAFALN